MKKLVFILLLVLAAWLLWRWWTGESSTADRGEKLFYNRVWIDHHPKADTDTVNVFAAITDEPMGIFQSTSTWKGQYEAFRYEPAGDGKMVLMYPQTKEKERAAYRARACSEQGFDYCLELQGASRGAKRYYSQRGWEIGRHAQLESLAQRVLPSAK